MVRIWMQLVASRRRLPGFLDALERQVRDVSGPDTEVTVSGTPHGALGDQYATFLHLDAHEIFRLARREVAGHGFDVYALANSLDPALDVLRETLEVPVLSLMQVGCSAATMLGDRFGVVVPNRRFVPAYERLVRGHGFGERLAGIQPMSFEHLSDLDVMFQDEVAARGTVDEVRRAAGPLMDSGAETLLVPGPVSCLLHHRGIVEVEGAVVIDLYSTLVKAAEAFAGLARDLGMTTSRVLRYGRPPPHLLDEAGRLYDL